MSEKQPQEMLVRTQQCMLGKVANQEIRWANPAIQKKIEKTITYLKEKKKEDMRLKFGKVKKSSLMYTENGEVHSKLL